MCGRLCLSDQSSWFVLIASRFEAHSSNRDALLMVRHIHQLSNCGARQGRATGSVSDRASVVNTVDLSISLTRSLPFPVLTSSPKLGALPTSGCQLPLFLLYPAPMKLNSRLTS